MNSPNFKTTLGKTRTPASGQTPPQHTHTHTHTSYTYFLKIIIPRMSLFTDNSFEINFVTILRDTCLETETDKAADVFHNYFHYQYNPEKY